MPVSSFPSLGLSPVEQTHDASEDFDPQMISIVPCGKNKIIILQMISIVPCGKNKIIILQKSMMEPCGENKIIILQKSMMEPCGENKVWGKNMRKMSAIKDETDERLRRAIADYMGVKKGNISKAMEEAINLWIESSARNLSTKV